MNAQAVTKVGPGSSNGGSRKDRQRADLSPPASMTAMLSESDKGRQRADLAPTAAMTSMSSMTLQVSTCASNHLFEFMCDAKITEHSIPARMKT